MTGEANRDAARSLQYAAVLATLAQTQATRELGAKIDKLTEHVVGLEHSMWRETL